MKHIRAEINGEPYDPCWAGVADWNTESEFFKELVRAIESGEDFETSYGSIEGSTYADITRENGNIHFVVTDTRWLDWIICDCAQTLPYFAYNADPQANTETMRVLEYDCGDCLQTLVEKLGIPRESIVLEQTIPDSTHLEYFECALLNLEAKADELWEKIRAELTTMLECALRLYHIGKKVNGKNE